MGASCSWYDFYGELLKENHKQIFEDYILNNFSLSEIAEERGISIQKLAKKYGVKQIYQLSLEILEEL